MRSARQLGGYDRGPHGQTFATARSLSHDITAGDCLRLSDVGNAASVLSRGDAQTQVGNPSTFALNSGCGRCASTLQNMKILP
jgi:hypothetical protein